MTAMQVGIQLLVRKKSMEKSDLVSAQGRLPCVLDKMFMSVNIRLNLLPIRVKTEVKIFQLL